MAEDIRDRAADALLALIPLYYKNVIRHKACGQRDTSGATPYTWGAYEIRLNADV